MKKLNLCQSSAQTANADILQGIASQLPYASRNHKVLMICGCDDACTSRFFALELAPAMAAGGKKVMVIDADLTNPKTDEAYAKADFGLTHYLSGGCAMDDIFYETAADGVSIIPVGVKAPNPDLLSDSKEMADLIQACAEKYDWVLVNAAPLTRYNSGSLPVVAQCDGVVFVARDHATHVNDIKAFQRLAKARGCAALGCVVLDAKKPREYQK